MAIESYTVLTCDVCGTATQSAESDPSSLDTKGWVSIAWEEQEEEWDGDDMFATLRPARAKGVTKHCCSIQCARQMLEGRDA